jgi:DMSO/TMAO reductase YedYZ molybdopterin-dependent catalytic subunit
VTDRRVVVRAEPFNAEAPLAALDQPITPVADFYVRSNFSVPQLDPSGWSLCVDGLVDRELELSLADLASWPVREITCTLECAGNNRSRLSPPTEGEPWGVGAISTATFSGIPLSSVLERVGVQGGAVEVRFQGADHGPIRGRPGVIHYERSLPLPAATGADVLIALRMDGEPLTPEHGAPARLLVPGWYGMASVKWLQRIEVLDHSLDAHFQTDRYRYHPVDADAAGPSRPVTVMLVNSMVTSVASEGVVAPGRQRICGAAWSGGSPIATVDVSIDSGPWRPAELIEPALEHAWRRWRFEWATATTGRHVIRSRATADDGSAQPERAAWNRLGYGNNAIAETQIDVR